MSSKLISTFELCRAVAKIIESNFEVKPGFLNSTVQRVLGSCTHFVSVAFRDSPMLCDLPILGSILVDEEYIFFPSVIMQQEALVPSAGEPPGDFPRKKLSLDKVAENAQIGVDQATAILDQIVKKIVSVILSSYFFS